MRKDYILLDDDLEIMVVPHKPGEPKWLTYDELDEARIKFPRFPRMLHYYNEVESWAKRASLKLRKEVGE